MGGPCTSYKDAQNFILNLSRILIVRNRSEEQGVDAMIILKYIW
jgi:hypothetical protein